MNCYDSNFMRYLSRLHHTFCVNVSQPTFFFFKFNFKLLFKQTKKSYWDTNWNTETRQAAAELHTKMLTCRGVKKKKCISNDQRATLDRTKFIFLKSSIFLREPVSKSRRPNHFPLQSVLSTAAPPPSLPLYSLSDDELLWIFSIKSSAILETSLPASWVGCPLLE